MSNQKGFFLGDLLLVLFVLAAAFGWVSNLVTLFGTDTLDGTTVVRAIGVFVVPLGAVVGYL